MAAKYEALAVELQAAIPEAKPEGAASLGGTIGLVLALVAAIRSGDVEQIKAAVLALLNVILAPSTPVNLRLAQFIQSEEAAVGINVVIDQVDSATLTKSEGSGSFDTGIAAWSGSPAVDRNVYQFLYTTGTRNFAGYSNGRLDGILDEACFERHRLGNQRGVLPVISGA